MVASLQGLQGNVSTGTQEDESNSGRVWVAGLTMLRSFLAWRAFWNLRIVYFFNFPFFFRAVTNRGCGGPPVIAYVECLLALTDVPYVFLNCCNGWKNYLSLDTRH